MPGGRPRNYWTSARERRLARLYCLSDLDIDEIQRLLATNGFNPSASDVQKRLRALLPRDYAKDYRRYRPSSRQNARLRFKHIHDCRENKMRKYRKLQRQARLDCQTVTVSDQADLNGDAVASPPASLYSNQASSVFPNIQYVSLPILSLKKTSEHSPPRDTFFVEGHRHFSITNSVCMDDSQRKSSPDTSIGIESASSHYGSPLISSHLRQEGTTHNLLHWPPAPNFTPAQSHKNSSLLATHDLDIDIPLKNRVYSESGKQDQSRISGALSVSSLRERLARGHSQSSLEHIKCVLRLSLGSSLRSSLISFMSLASSAKSRRSETISQPPVSAISIPLTKTERTIWDMLIDETQISHPRPSYYEISLTERPCCGLMKDLFDAPCRKCGFLSVHFYAREYIDHISDEFNGPNLTLIKQINATDCFGNRPLHFAAASGKANISTIMSLISKGAIINAENTCGETFMHVLDPSSLGGITGYLVLLKHLKALGFPFSHRDCHGRAIVHALFEIIEPQQFSDSNWKTLLEFTGPLYNVFDSMGKRCHWEVMRYVRKSESPPGLKQIATAFSLDKGDVPILDYRLVTSAAETWVTRSKQRGLIDVPDVNGDTSLLHMLKYSDDIENLETTILNYFPAIGAGVDMRDRIGNTALGIAVKRGFRPVAKALLGKGANPNARNYQSSGILSQATHYLIKANKDDNGKLYAKILSCMMLLIDHGMKEKPTVYDEWMLDRPQSRS